MATIAMGSSLGVAPVGVTAAAVVVVVSCWWR
jgi:hypothetical protein